jgi:hypothetical protein
MKMIDTANGDTLWAVVVGAFLATLGGFLATQFESWLRRRERKRGAALLLGDIVSALGELTSRAEATRKVGDPYGPITMRMMRAARREIDLYDRNRELLYDLHDPELRLRIHTLMLTLAMPLDSLADVGEVIAAQELRAKEYKAGSAARLEVEARLKQLHAARDLAFDFIVETAAEGQPMIKELDAHAKVTRSSRRPGQRLDPPAADPA